MCVERKPASVFALFCLDIKLFNTLHYIQYLNIHFPTDLQWIAIKMSQAGRFKNRDLLNVDISTFTYITLDV
jgi:hypothetical protein